MRRRAMLRTVGTVVVVGSAGCVGGGEVVEEIQRSVRVEPGQYWQRELPDVSDPGGSIEYVVRADRGFDVLLFTNGEDYTTYQAALRNEASESTPTGHDDLSTTAVPTGEDSFEAATQNGARQPLDAEGPYHFVVDHTDYGVGAQPEEPGHTLSVAVDLTLVRNRF